MLDTHTLRGIVAVVGSLCALMAAALAWETPTDDGAGIRGLMALDLLGVLWCAAAWRAAGRWPLRRSARLSAWLAAALILAQTAVHRQAPPVMELGFLSLVVCGAAVWLGRNDALQIAAAGVVATLLLQIASPAGWQLLSLGRQWLLIGSGLGLGLLMASAQRRMAGEANEQRERFRSLLEMAVDTYWELDADLRLVKADHPQDLPAGVSQALEKGKRPWEVHGHTIDPDQLPAHREDLLARRRFDNLSVTRRLADGRTLHYRVSGAPRFDEDGVFLGYWGVRRDVTSEHEASVAMAASAARFRDLFERAPSAIVVQRRGRVLDANASAVALFGFGSLDAMRGQDLLALFEAGDSRERARAEAQLLETLPEGRSLPVAEYRLTPRSGQVLIVRAYSSRIRIDGVDAHLTLYTDDTLRRQAEQAVARSEALLSNLVATSPDLIALADFETGRFAMVNPAFTRITGYRQAELIGHTSLELGFWARPADRRTIVDALRQGAPVQNLPFTVVARDRRRLPMLVSAARFAMDGRDYLVLIGRDISAAEQDRLEREAIFENALIGIAFARDQHFTMTNPRFDEMFGWPRGLLKGQNERVVWPLLDDYDLAVRALVPSVEPALAPGQQIELERPMSRRDGSLFRCRILGKAIDPSHPGQGGTIWLAEDVTDRYQVELALAKARDDAEAANRAKSAFLANTSHEIRTPLNALLGLATLARAPELDERRREHYIEQISESARTLSAILSDILDLSKIEAGKLHVEHVPFDLHELLAKLQQAYGSLADIRGLAMSLEIDPDVPAVVRGDPMRVRQILTNYLNNALKFTESGRIGMSARRGRGDTVRFEVIDTGTGIDDATRGRLFTPFSQADNSTTRRVGGTGLGLSICRQLARMMGGDVGLESVEGEGSLFWVELPLPGGDALDVESTRGGLGLDLVSGARVLLVEDNAVNMMIAAALLEQWDIRVLQAGDGREAIEAVDAAVQRGEPVDAVLMDVQMPVMSGHEATRVLRQRYSSAALPIIALTAAALVSERDEALAAGMNDFLAKPIDAQHLRATLTRVLRGRHLAGRGP